MRRFAANSATATAAVASSTHAVLDAAAARRGIMHSSSSISTFATTPSTTNITSHANTNTNTEGDVFSASSSTTLTSSTSLLFPQSNLTATAAATPLSSSTTTFTTINTPSTLASSHRATSSSVFAGSSNSSAAPLRATPMRLARITHDPRPSYAAHPTVDEISAVEDSFEAAEDHRSMAGSVNRAVQSVPSAAGGGGAIAGAGANKSEVNEQGLVTNLAVDDRTVAPERNEALMIAIDCLCDDFFNCRPDVLKQFARSRGAAGLSKAETVSRLIDKAVEETVSTGQLKYTNQLIGKVFNDNVRTSGVRSKWTDQSLEASFVEAAAERHVKFTAMAQRQQAMAARLNGKRGESLMKKLLRPFTEEFPALCDQAVQGVHRSYRTELDELLKTRGSVEVLSPFCTYLVNNVSAAAATQLIGRTDVMRKLHELGLYKHTIDDCAEQTLESLMGLLDFLAEDATQRQAEWDKMYHNYGRDVPEVRLIQLKVFLNSNRFWELDDVPAWVTEFAVKFGNWETVIRNDIKLLENAPSIVFAAFLTGVANYRLTRMIYGDGVDATQLDRESSGLLRCALKEFFQDEDKLNECITHIHNFLGIRGGDGRFITASTFAAIDSQLQSMLQDGNANPAETTERVAIILHQATATATGAERMAGIYPLLMRLTVDLNFHFRFAKCFDKLSTREKKFIRSAKPRNLMSSLGYFEKDMGITPIGMKPIAFLSIILLFMALRTNPQHGGKAICERYSSITGRDEFGLVTLVDMDRKMTANDLNIALPPQLTYNSWLDRDGVQNKSVYGAVKSNVVKGGANDLMLLSQAPIIKALDAISKVPWRISKFMLYVQEEIIRQGFSSGKVRPSFYPLHYTNKKSGVIVHEELDRSIYNHELQKEYTKQRDLDWRRISELRSSRVHYLQALRQARALIQYSHVYFPNSLDFRGRMYPIPGRLNHTGSDPFRALLEHAEPKPLGKVGVYWLKVHLANKMGMTKLSFDERVRYVDDHITDVINSAEAPLTGDRWWQDTSEPMQALMACKELSEALKCSQGPEAYMSHIPVAVDGSYNGLQHYSAIGRDEYGAELVNLIPSERPADAYTGILKEMMKSIERDARNNVQVAMRCLGTGQGQDRNHIKRKTIKRPIMTQVYGVTGYGMQEQIFEELYRQNFKHGLWTRVDVKEMSKYLREKVLESLGVTFKETQECRKWLDQVTRVIWRCQPRDLRNAFSWTTPLGLIVRQPYRVHKDTGLFTLSGFARISAQTISPASPKQLSAIAPNLIHSLDATHLAMTALEMQNRGLSMMAVHDSFWTYACDLPIMSQVLREQFVALYDNYDPLFELKEQWEEQFFFDLRRHGMKLPDPPKRGELDLKEVLNSQYFFS